MNIKIECYCGNQFYFGKANIKNNKLKEIQFV